MQSELLHIIRRTINSYSELIWLNLPLISFFLHKVPYFAPDSTIVPSLMG